MCDSPNSPKRLRLAEDKDEEGMESDSDRSVASDKSSKGTRPPFTSSHKIIREKNKFHLLIGVTGSIAVIKLHELIQQLNTAISADKLSIKETVYEDRDEWSMWKERGDPVLHIELRKWADAMIIAPLDANSMGKIVNGICDNLLTCIVRAWDFSKPLYYAPAMNTFMWESPITFHQRKQLQEFLRFKEIPPMDKTLMCGDKGIGAMASVQMISSILVQMIRNKFAIYSEVNEE